MAETLVFLLVAAALLWAFEPGLRQWRRERRDARRRNTAQPWR